MKLILVIFLSFLSAPIYKTQVDEFRIIWNSTRKLTFLDFKADVDKSSSLSASTTIQIQKKASLVEDSLEYSIVCTFLGSKSWIKATKKNLLNHEQLHFDIGELYARKIRQQFYTLEYSEKNYGILLDSVYKVNWKQLILEQEKYDIETGHSVIDSIQQRWKNEIDFELNELSAFKDTLCTILITEENE